MRTDHVDSTPTLSTTVVYFFLCFYLIFWLYLHWLPYLEMCTDHVNTIPMLSTTAYIMSILFFSFFFPDFLAIFTLTTIFGNAHRPCKQLSNITTPSLFFFWFFSYFFNWKCKTCNVWHFLVFIPVTGFQCHSVLVNSGDCSGELLEFPCLTRVLGSP